MARHLIECMHKGRQRAGTVSWVLRDYLGRHHLLTALTPVMWYSPPKEKRKKGDPTPTGRGANAIQQIVPVHKFACEGGAKMSRLDLLETSFVKSALFCLGLMLKRLGHVSSGRIIAPRVIGKKEGYYEDVLLNVGLMSRCDRGRRSMMAK